MDLEDQVNLQKMYVEGLFISRDNREAMRELFSMNNHIVQVVDLVSGHLESNLEEICLRFYLKGIHLIHRHIRGHDRFTEDRVFAKPILDYQTHRFSGHVFMAIIYHDLGLYQRAKTELDQCVKLPEYEKNEYVQRLMREVKEDIADRDWAMGTQERNTGGIDLTPADKKARNSAQLTWKQKADRAMETKEKTVFKVLGIDDKELIETDLEREIILEKKIDKESVLNFYESYYTILSNLIKGPMGDKLFRVVDELLLNSTSHPSNGEKISVTMKTFLNTSGQRIFKMTIHQKHLLESEDVDDWKTLQGNAQLDLSFQDDIRTKKKLFKNKGGGAGLRVFMKYFANLVPSRLEYGKDATGGMTTTLWAKVDPALVAQNTGGIDLTPANMHVETRTGSPTEAFGDDKGIKFHLDPAMLERLRNAPGFVPVIISVEPMKDLKAFLMNA